MFYIEIPLFVFIIIALDVGGNSASDINTIVLRRSRKAGSGTIAKFFDDEVKWREKNNLLSQQVSLILDSGTMKPFDSCCLVPCGNRTATPWKPNHIFTVSHIREPVDWRRSEYYYGGGGCVQVLPSNKSIATPKDSPRIWVEWMGEFDQTLKPKDTCGNEPLVGYDNRFDKKFRWHEGFGYYQPDFMVRNSIAECGCRHPFVKVDGSLSQGDCSQTHGTTFLFDPSLKKYPPISDYHLSQAKTVLSQFDLLIPTDHLAHPLLTRFVLWKMKWLYPCNRTMTVMNGKGGVKSLIHPRIQFNHLHKTVSETFKVRKRQKDFVADVDTSKHNQLYGNRPIPECIKQVIMEQNRLDAELYRWAENKFRVELDEFAKLDPEITCLGNH